MATRSQISSNWRAKAQPPSNIDRLDIEHEKPQHNNNNAMTEPSPTPPSNETEIRGETDPRTLQAIAEGRRLYVGNLPYMAQTKDIENLFAQHDYQMYTPNPIPKKTPSIPSSPNFLKKKTHLLTANAPLNNSDHINMSTDPYSGRNPSYCFVELAHKSQAERAIQHLNGQYLLGRPLKIGPGIAAASKKRTATMKQNNRNHEKYPQEEPVFQRWTRTDAPDHFEYGKQGRRVWVGGLPQMGAHSAVNAGVRELFAGFEM